MATLRRDGVGRYFVSMAMDEEILPLPVVDRAVGVDTGLSAAVTLDDGTKVAPLPIRHFHAWWCGETLQDWEGG
jgi:putative transposase